MNSAIAIIALALSLVTSVVAVTTVIVQMRTNMDHLRTQAQAHEDREDSAAKEIAEMFVLLKSFIAEQTVINKTMTLALEGTIRKLEDMDRRTVEASTVIALLTQILKDKSVQVKGLNIEP